MFDTSPKPILPRFTAVILTALETEYKAVRDLLVETKVIVGPSGRDYREGRFHRRPDGTGDHAPWRVLIHEGGRDQMNALRATEDSARDWCPHAILFVGVAGGRPGKARHFEVLVGREIAYYETAKVTADGLRQWTKTAEAENSPLFRAAKMERDETDEGGQPAWIGRVRRSQMANLIAAKGITEDLRARMAPIASGEKVITDPHSTLWTEIERNAYRVEAVETEGYGFSFAQCQDLDGRPIPRLMVRGISDMMGDKNQPVVSAVAGEPKRPAYLDGLDDDERQKIASAAAAAFAFQVLVRFGDMYLGSKAPAIPSPRLEKVVLKLHGDDEAALKRNLNAIQSYLVAWAPQTVVIDLRPGSLIATLRAHPAAVAVLRALDDGGLLDSLAGVRTTILQAPSAEDLDISEDLRAVAAAIARLGTEDAARREAAISRLTELSGSHPEWRIAIQTLMTLVDVKPASIPVDGRDGSELLRSASPALEVSASYDGKAAGRDQNNYAPPPELVEVLIASATRPLEKLNERQQAEIQQLRERLGTSDGVLHRVAAILGAHLAEGDIPFDQLSQRLVDMVRQREEMIAQQRALPPDPDAEFARIQRDLDAALADGDDERARQFLLEKRDAKLTASKKSRETSDTLQASANRDQLDAAESESALGDLALTRLEYLAAADHLQAAVDLLPPSASDVRGNYLNRYASALQVQGDEKGDNAALLKAINVYRRALLDFPRERVPLNWAMIQNNLGSALSILGERESGTARLEEAVDAFHAALQEYTRERVPLGWAMTQNNLGTVLQSLGERESDTARLEEATEAFRNALQEYTRERVPLDWAMTQNNLGNTLWRLGDCESGTTRLEEAVEAFRAALQESTRERVPLDWAMTQNSLGNTLWRLGERENDPVRLEEALEVILGARETYRNADMMQFEDDFEDRIGKIEALIATIGRK